MQLKVFLACPIDSGGTQWEISRETLINFCEELDCEVIGAGKGPNPLIPNYSPVSVCKVVMNHDLTEQRRAHVTLVATGLEEFSVGTWIEMWEAYKAGQYIILFITSNLEVESVFLKGLADVIVHDRDFDALEGCLRELQEGIRHE